MADEFRKIMDSYFCPGGIKCSCNSSCRRVRKVLMRGNRQKFKINSNRIIKEEVNDSSNSNNSMEKAD